MLPALLSFGFKPRAREGRDLAASLNSPAVFMFQATRPRRARQPAQALHWVRKRVSSHAPAKGATCTLAALPASQPCFKPRAREGRDEAAHVNYSQILQVSSHAPAKGATVGLLAQLLGYDVSSHAPAKGATFRRTLEIPLVAVSSHAPAKGATLALIQLVHERDVSSHAPAKGATCWRSPRTGGSHCFKPRAREGRDALAIKASSIQKCFKPRAREGRDSSTRSGRRPGACFKPRAREGRDNVAHLLAGLNKRFQATRPRRARRACDQSIIDPEVFQATRPRRARLFDTLWPAAWGVFQATRPRRARQCRASSGWS